MVMSSEEPLHRLGVDVRSLVTLTATKSSRLEEEPDPRSRTPAELPPGVPLRVPDVGSALASDPSRRACLGSPIRRAGEGRCIYNAIGSPGFEATLHRMGAGC